VDLEWESRPPLETGKIFLPRSGKKMRKTIVLLLTMMIVILPDQVLAAGGRILTLNAWGGWAPDTPVDVQSTITADSKLSTSNLYYTISLGSTLYFNHTTNLSPMNSNETRNDQWETVNSGWPAGDYTVTLCWSKGNSHNCDIAGPTSVTVHFVPTLGWELTLVLLGFLLYVVWRRRKDFELVGQKVEA
jgi:hypothetical protein